MKKNEINETRMVVRESARKGVKNSCSLFDAKKEQLIKYIYRGTGYRKKRETANFPEQFDSNSGRSEIAEKEFCRSVDVKDRKWKTFTKKSSFFLCANLQKNKLVTERGITLLALIITVVIMLILAAVTINVTLGDGGLVQQARLAAERTQNAAEKEQAEIDSLQQELANILAEDSEITPPTPTLPEGWDGTKVTPVQSSDGKTVPVPIGYTASSATGENSVNDGFVIYEGTGVVNDSNVGSAKTSRNQFVWIPVDDISQIANQTSGTDGNGRQNYQGKLYNFSTSGATEMSNYGQGTTSNREPDVVTGNSSGTGTDYDGDSEYLSILDLSNSGQFKTQLQEEYNEMVESVDTYGGFYIGRYETGNLASNTSTEPVVQKGNNSNGGGVNWYYMYQNSRKIAANSNVVSTMIWGSMFDRALIWLTETGDKTYSDLMDSSSWGNYRDSTGAAATNSGSKQPTGTNDAWQANNIYDLAGNVYDWTIEANSTSYRVIRGGAYGNYGSRDPASYRNSNGFPSDTYSTYGSRSALYVK